MKNLTLFLLSFLFLYSLQAQDLENALFDLADVRFEKVEDNVYELRVKQPIDHTHPEKGYFYQRAFLTHKGFDRPTVMCTEGYQRPRNRMYELTTLLDANQIDIEHRYFGESVPDSMMWEYLTLEQATADLHKINQLFRNLYKGKWVSTGISKGGQTTIFYRYFYPNDVDVSVPYVAPLNLDIEDKRIYEFLDKVGTAECRKKIYDLQVRLLKSRKEVLPLLKWYSKGADLKFEYLSLEEAFEYGVLEYPFSFWQWGSDCKDIPSAKAPLDEVLQHFMDVAGISFFSDRDMDRYASHYYQAGSQMGYYGYDTEDFKGLLKALPMSPNPSAVFMPNKMKVEHNGEVPQKTFDWLKTDGDRFIYIYGEVDTWSATAVPPSKEVDAEWFFLKGKAHQSARIKNMTAEEKKKMITRLEKWLEMEID